MPFEPKWTPVLDTGGISLPPMTPDVRAFLAQLRRLRELHGRDTHRVDWTTEHLPDGGMRVTYTATPIATEPPHAR